MFPSSRTLRGTYRKGALPSFEVVLDNIMQLASFLVTEGRLSKKTVVPSHLSMLEIRTDKITTIGHIVVWATTSEYDFEAEGYSADNVVCLRVQLSLKPISMRIPHFEKLDVLPLFKYPVVVIGAGFQGLLCAAHLVKCGIPVIVLEKASTVGGVWNALANKDSCLQTESATYMVELFQDHVAAPHATVYAGKAEVLRHVSSLLSVVGAARVRLSTEVIHIEKRGASFSVSTNDSSELRASAVFVFPGRLAVQRSVMYKGEESWKDRVLDGFGCGTEKTSFLDKIVVVVGMGAFAVENARTALLRGAQKVILMVRRKQLVIPCLASYVINTTTDPVSVKTIVERYARPFYETVGDVTDLTSPQNVDQLSSAGLNPVSDFFFLAKKLGRLVVVEDEIAELLQGSVLKTLKGDFVEAHIIVKCIGFEPDVKMDRVMQVTSLSGLWVNGDHNFFTYREGRGSRGVLSLDSTSAVTLLERAVACACFFLHNPQEFARVKHLLPSCSSCCEYGALYLGQTFQVLASQIAPLGVSFVETLSRKVLQSKLYSFEQFRQFLRREWVLNAGLLRCDVVPDYPLFEVPAISITQGPKMIDISAPSEFNDMNFGHGDAIFVKPWPGSDVRRLFSFAQDLSRKLMPYKDLKLCFHSPNRLEHSVVWGVARSLRGIRRDWNVKVIVSEDAITHQLWDAMAKSRILYHETVLFREHEGFSSKKVRVTSAETNSSHDFGHTVVVFGSGALGVIFAEEALRLGFMEVVLVSRTVKATEARFVQYNSERAPLYLLQADFRKGEDCAAMMLQVSSRRTSFIFSAGTSFWDSSVVGDMLAPKVSLLSLYKVVHRRPHCRLILLSSIANLVGGNSGYVAGNTFLDSFANSRHIPAQSFLVTGVSGVGMWRGRTEEQQALLDQGFRFSSPEALADSVFKIFSSNLDSGCFLLDEGSDWSSVSLSLGICIPEFSNSGKRFVVAEQKSSTEPSLGRVDDVSTLETVSNALKRALGTEEIFQDVGFLEQGLDSLGSMTFINELRTAFGRENITSTALFDFPTVRDLADYLSLRVPAGVASDTVGPLRGTVLFHPGTFGSRDAYASLLNAFRDASVAVHFMDWVSDSETPSESARRNISRMVNAGLKFDKVCIIGHSSGGYVAYEMAVLLEECVGLVLVDCFFGPELFGDRPVTFDSLSRGVLKLVGFDADTIPATICQPLAAGLLLENGLFDTFTRKMLYSDLSVIQHEKWRLWCPSLVFLRECTFFKATPSMDPHMWKGSLPNMIVGIAENSNHFTICSAKHKDIVSTCLQMLDVSESPESQ
jgi:thioredoxin reductase/pimeloyl-ACP methyl ester carboxylesterase